MTAKSKVALGFAALWAAGLVGGCEPDLPDAPFSCGVDGSCPDGYSCVSTVCQLDGSVPAVARPLRTTWINAAEMYWFASATGDGATLVVNNGFTAGERGLFEIHVASDGTVGEPRQILDLPEDFPSSTAVFLLDDAHYGVLALRFPSIHEDEQTLQLLKVARDVSSDEDVSVATIYETTVTYLGGTEPPYISAIQGPGGATLCYTDPSEGGVLHVQTIAEDGEVERNLLLDLPTTILPLSGDCLLWRVGDDLVARIGLDAPLVYRIPADATSGADFSGPIEVPGLVVYAFDNSVTSLVLSETGEDTYAATLVTSDWQGSTLDTTEIGAYPGQLEPHTAWSSPGDNVLFMPSSSDVSFPDLKVLRLDGELASELLTIERTGTDPLYSARAFELDGRAYLAWTATHADLMDLWVASADAP